MNQATVVTRKDARTLLRLHGALGDMLEHMDGLLTRRRPKRKPAVRRKRTGAPATAMTNAATQAVQALAKAKAKAARTAANVTEG